MTDIQIEMQKLFKINAKKKLYYAISVMFHQSIDQLEKLSQAGKVLVESFQENGAGEPKEIMKAMAAEKLNLTRSIYCMGASLIEYKKALGEYPEFTKFMASSPEKLEDLLRMSANAMKEAEKYIGECNCSECKKKKSTDMHKLTEHAFGEGFISLSEAIKIKGEE